MSFLKFLYNSVEFFLDISLVIYFLGFHGKEVANLAGLDLPLVPCHHQYLVTAPIPKVQELKKEFPVIRHKEGSFYMRRERGGLLIGPYESEKKMQISEDWVKNGVPLSKYIYFFVDFICFLYF